MGKRLMIDEASRTPKFIRFVVMFDCGCSFYNDAWQSERECLLVCPEHRLEKRVHSHHLVAGTRPKLGKLKRHTLKIKLSKE